MFVKLLSSEAFERIRQRFNRLYGPAQAVRCSERLAAMIGRYGIGYSPVEPRPLWNEQTAVLITYADAIRRKGEPPLATLAQFAASRLNDAFNTIHLLPFFPSSSDDGFSVTDYRQTDPACGGWPQVRDLARHFDLMFDLVLNHVSRRSRWFTHYLSGLAPYRDYFIEADPGADLSAAVRPRDLPLLTAVRVDGAEKHLWTTFSPDQMDLNFANPDVLFEFLDLLLFYIANGAKIIRLDAVAFLWKQPGTACIHLEQTHEIVRLLRDLADLAAPGVIVLTETNVPHAENISYFGNGGEAHMVYQFALPPLLLHALLTENAEHLTGWARTVCETPAGCTWLNFTASHDGIGVRPLDGILPAGETEALLRMLQERGGHIAKRRAPDGSGHPYEVNITYVDALGGDALQTERFLCSQTVMLALKGVPGVYFNSLLAAPNDTAGVRATGRPRSINRQKWTLPLLEKRLRSPGPARTVFEETLRRLRLRRNHPAFHPDAAQRVLDTGRERFAFVRTAAGGQAVVCISNVSSSRADVRPGDRIPELAGPGSCTDLLSGTRFSGSNKQIPLNPFQTVWLTPNP